MNEELGAFSALEQSLQPGMPNLEDLDPEMVANRAHEMAMAEAFQPISPQDMKDQIPQLLQEEAVKKHAQSRDFQTKSYMMNRNSGQ